MVAFRSRLSAVVRPRSLSVAVFDIMAETPRGNLPARMLEKSDYIDLRLI